MSDSILYNIDGPVAIITLNRPERLNAMDQEMLEKLTAAADRASAPPDRDPRAAQLPAPGTSARTRRMTGTASLVAVCIGRWKATKSLSNASRLKASRDRSMVLTSTPASRSQAAGEATPIDPVLAADVQVGPPSSGPGDKVRASLTSEAGLNDGLAFPFTYLAIAVAINGTSPGATPRHALSSGHLKKRRRGAAPAARTPRSTASRSVRGGSRSNFSSTTHATIPAAAKVKCDNRQPWMIHDSGVPGMCWGGRSAMAPPYLPAMITAAL